MFGQGTTSSEQQRLILDQAHDLHALNTAQQDVQRAVRLPGHAHDVCFDADTVEIVITHKLTFVRAPRHRQHRPVGGQRRLERGVALPVADEERREALGKEDSVRQRQNG